MLALTRKCGEKVVIDEQIVITVTQIANGKVKIGIEAPGTSLSCVANWRATRKLRRSAATGWSRIERTSFHRQRPTPRWSH